MQSSHNILVGVFVFFVLDSSSVTGNKYPRNTVAVAGDAVLLECQAIKGDINDYSWLYHGVMTITQGTILVKPQFADALTLVYDYTTHRYDLKLNVSATGHVQQYSCGNDHRRGFADLIVLNVPPACRVSADLSNLIDGEPFNVQCTVTYKSRPWWNAVMECRDNVSGINQPTEDAGSVDGLVMKRQFSVIANTSLQDHSYSCSISFPAPPKDDTIEDSEREKYSKKAPTYIFHYQTTRIHVHPQQTTTPPPTASDLSPAAIAGTTVATVGGFTALILAFVVFRKCDCHIIDSFKCRCFDNSGYSSINR